MGGVVAKSGVVNNFSYSITSSQERARSFFCGELPHMAVLIDGSVSPERNEAAAW
jgi:hypothetical protein